MYSNTGSIAARWQRTFRFKWKASRARTEYPKMRLDATGYGTDWVAFKRA